MLKLCNYKYYIYYTCIQEYKCVHCVGPMATIVYDKFGKNCILLKLCKTTIAWLQLYMTTIMICDIARNMNSL